MNGGLSAISSTGIFAAQASRVLKRQQHCKGIKPKSCVSCDGFMMCDIVAPKSNGDFWALVAVPVNPTY